MKKLTLTFVCAAALSIAALAQDLSPALVFKRDKLVPALAHTLWRDESLSFWGLTASLDALVGYDPSPASEQLLIDYAFVLNKPLTETTSLFGGVAYLAPIGEVRWQDLWDRLGLVAGMRIKL